MDIKFSYRKAVEEIKKALKMDPSFASEAERIDSLYMEDKYKSIAFICNNPDFKELRSEFRFQEMIKKLGLSDYAKYEL